MEFKKRPEYVDFYIIGDIDEDMYSDLTEKVFNKVKELDDIDKENERLALSLGLDIAPLRTKVKFIFHVSTYGGECYDGLGICDLLRRLDEGDNDIDVLVVCEGKVMSAGIPIICSVKNRIATSNTTFMIHQIGGFSAGKIKDVEEYLEEGKRLWGKCKEIIVNNTKITIEQIEEWDKCRSDSFFDAEKALEYGLIKGIV